MQTPYGEKKVIYADWIASGRLYMPIEQKIQEEFGPWVANTHTETSETGTLMTKSYDWAQHIIKNHVNATEDDILITSGSGMTSVINKFQRIIGIKSCGKLIDDKCIISEKEKAVIFITHMEHHSNQTSWLETNSDVIVLEPNEDLTVNPDELRRQLEKYKDRKTKIGSFSACSNVTGVRTNYHELAKIMHQNGGLCFIDFAANAPYEDMNMHPSDPDEKLDAIFFSPHKFLGGPGSSGVLIFDKELYANNTPDHPGGGTVDWTNPWGEHKYIDDIEAREDGGTPGFLQSIRAALAIELKEQMGVKNIMMREHQLINKAIDGLSNIEGIQVLAPEHKNRIGAISFYHNTIHYNFIVKLLSDKYGVQVRGGCACAGTYGHIMLDVDYETSRLITDKIDNGDLTEKPGFVRLSIHPIMTDNELEIVITAITDIVNNYERYKEDYIFYPETNEFQPKKEINKNKLLDQWFKI